MVIRWLILDLAADTGGGGDSKKHEIFFLTSFSVPRDRTSSAMDPLFYFNCRIVLFLSWDTWPFYQKLKKKFVGFQFLLE